MNCLKNSLVGAKAVAPGAKVKIRVQKTTSIEVGVKILLLLVIASRAPLAN